MTNFNKAIRTLEFDKVSEMLADCARTEGAKLLARTLTPETDAVRVEASTLTSYSTNILMASPSGRQI